MLMVNQFTGFGARRAVRSFSAEVAAFLARTTGLDTAHINAYADFIDGLVAAGVWSKFDVLYIFATQDGTTALLNLVSSSYNATSNNSPTFAADRGFTGLNNASITWIDSGFNATTAVSPQFTQNSAHISAWSVTNVGAFTQAIIGIQNGGSLGSTIDPAWTDGNTYLRVNTNSALGFTNSNSSGHFLANRSNSTSEQGYRNGSSIATSTSHNSTALINGNIRTLGNNDVGGPGFTGGPYQVAAASIGSSLSSTDVTNFYNLLRTFMTAVGVP